MKKKIIIIIPILVVFSIVLCCILLLPKKNYLIMTLDINPSFEIRLKEDYTIQKVIPNNSDAKDLIHDNFKNKKLKDFFQVLASKLVDSPYTEFDQLSVLLYLDPKLNREEVQGMFIDPYDKEQIAVDFHFVESITKEDIKLAKKYHITPAKASYLREIKANNKNISYESLLQKSIQEIHNMIDTGSYCDEGYFLDGTRCLKEIKREPAKSGDVCPNGYTEYQGKCYQQGRSHEKKDSFICPEDFTKTNDGKCKKNEEEAAIGVCPDGGEYHHEEDTCYVKTYIGDAIEFCRITTESDMLIDHKCYGPKPMINGGCLNGDSIVNGWCIDYGSYYSSDWKCPDGHFISNPDGEVPDGDYKCYDIQHVSPTSYKCNHKDQKLEGHKCLREVIENAEAEVYCDEGEFLIDGSRCINMSKEVEFVPGKICDMPNSRLDGDVCVLYEVVDAKK